MATILVILFIICLLGMIGGLIKPEAMGKDVTRGKVLLGFGTALLVLFLLISWVGAKNGKQSEAKPEPAQASEMEQSWAYKLASIEGQGLRPTDSFVASFDTVLKSLNRKCQEDNEERLADLIVRSKELLKDKKGTEMKLLEIGQRLDQSIPDEANDDVDCNQVAAAFLTLVSSK